MKTLSLAQIAISCLLLPLPNLFAATPSTNTPTRPLKQAVMQQNSTCPPVSALKRQASNKLLWQAPNGWSTTHASFIKTISRFQSAHWIGVDVGSMLCTYAGKDKLTFPMTLENARLVYSPSGDKWSRNIKGIKGCVSNNIKDCPFKMVAKKSGPSQFKSLDNIRLPGDPGSQ